MKFKNVNIIPLIFVLNLSTLYSQQLEIINFELKLTLKLLGDEYFLKGDKYLDKAKSSYLEAKKISINETIINKSGLFYGTENSNKYLIELLDKEIDYRLLLLENDIDFWGLDYNMKVLIPKDRLVKFSETFNKLSLVYNKITALRDQTESINVTLEDRNLSKDLCLNNGFQEILINEKNADLSIIYDNTITTFNNRIESYTAQNIELDRQANVIIESLKSNEKEITSSINTYIFNQLGIPDPTTMKLDENFGLNILKDFPVSGQLLSLSENTYGLLSTTKNLFETYENVNKIINTGTAIKDFIENPEPNNFFELSEIIQPYLNNESMADLKIRIDNLKYFYTESKRILDKLDDAKDFSAILNNCAK